MKVLAIRGYNLASLAGHFELDLLNGPLGQAGLFAITGPTGAGKSTLLDALCLALFNTTPRFNAQGGAYVGYSNQKKQDRIRANDVRTILRRGTAHGFAEVDFIGKSLVPHRAKWSVRRSRNKPTGRLQAIEMDLEIIHSGEKKGSKTIDLDKKRLQNH